MQKLGNFIDGHYSAPASGEYLENKNPSTGETYSLVPDSDGRDVEKAVVAAKKIFPWWASRTREQRFQAMMKVAETMEKYADELARAESLDQGKPLWLSREVEIPRAILNFRFFATEILHEEVRASHLDGKNSAVVYTQRTPHGVAGLISPWNLPLYLLTWKIAPAIAAGNTVICKPSELTPMTAHMMGDIFNEAGLPHGVVNIIFGGGAKAGAALTAHPEVPLISFTGGTETGKAVMTAGVQGIKKVGLELGGKNAGIVFADADLSDAVVTSVRSSFQNQGEICLCNSRLLVQETVYDEFLEKLVRLTELQRVGDPMLKETNLGPLVSEAHRKKVLSYVELAKKEGGKIVIGGDVPKLPAPFTNGYFMNPTIITGLAPNCRTMQEEIFGPVVTVTPFKTEEEAIAIANGTKYGLSASVWSQNVSRANRVAMSLHTGMVWINSWMLRDLRMPFGGAKQSGIGREGGHDSLDFFSETKSIYMKV